jgi:uncharacterized protein (TIGR02172 family)
LSETENTQGRGPLVGVGRTAEVYAWGEGQVLKLYRAGLPRAWVEREARVGRIVAAAGLHAPAVGELVEVDGRWGIVYQRIEGPSMLDTLVARPEMLAPLAEQFAGLHAEMHACLRPELHSQRAALTHAIEQAAPLDPALRQTVLRHLAQLPAGEAVCHGDYHPGNVVLTGQGPVVIDWMTATHGSPAADVARTALLFRIGQLPPEIDAAARQAIDQARAAFFDHYLQAYRAQRPLAQAEIDAWLPVMAAARLTEAIEGEAASLLTLVRAL